MTCEPAIDAREAARILRIHHLTVQQYAREGRIPCFRLGRVWRFRASALDEWMRQQIQSHSPLASPHQQGELQ